MHLDKKNIDLVSVQWATSSQQSYLEFCKKVIEDKDKKERLEKCECQVCYFKSRIGGAALSQRPCGLCEEIIHAGNTCVDVLCKECAKKHRLCKRCGATIDLKNRRKFIKNE